MAGTLIHPGDMLREGAVVVDRAAILGAAVPEPMLRERSPAELRERQDRARGWSLAPGSARLAVAVIAATPEGAERFRIVAVPVSEKPSGPQLAERLPGD